jgi:hypothetical protein
MDYKPFKDEASWIRFNFRLPPLNLTDSDISLTLTTFDNLDLDKIQRGWLTKSFKTLFKRLKEVNRDQTH